MNELQAGILFVFMIVFIVGMVIVFKANIKARNQRNEGTQQESQQESQRLDILLHNLETGFDKPYYAKPVKTETEGTLTNPIAPTPKRKEE